MLQIVKSCIRWFKRNRKPDLRDKCIEMYGKEFGEIYDNMAKGIPVGGFTETAYYIKLIEEARKEGKKMTIDELKQIKFHMVAHLSMAKEHQCTYADDSGRLGFCDITKKKNEFEFGESRRAYRIDGNWYDTKEEFIKALERFGFGPQLPKKGGNND